MTLASKLFASCQRETFEELQFLSIRPLSTADSTSASEHSILSISIHLRQITRHDKIIGVSPHKV